LDVERKDAEGNVFLVNYVTFKRMTYNEETERTEWKADIKISRGEENIFKWCFFLAVAQMAIDKAEAYDWVKYIYVDDPISSLDDNNAILVANHLSSLIKQETNSIHTIISTHHGLFYNVMCNELKNAPRYYLYKEQESSDDVTKQAKYVWKLKDLKDTPFFHHVSIIKELNKAVSDDGQLYTYHFNMLRNVLEKTAAFHGFEKFSDCIKKFEDDPDEQLYSRMINIFSHGNYSVFEPVEMNDENKTYFKKIYVSYEIGLEKPDRAIYEHMLKDGDMKAEETLFIDDREQNTKGAESVGINTYLVKNSEAWIPDLINKFLKH
jgi:HAD superfamily hydrolase (TIGR01509 family)